MTTAVNSSPIAMSPSDSSDSSLDSPSRQLLRELRLLQIRNQSSFYERLEEKDLHLAREHNAGLAAAAARHEQVRRDAEEMLKQYNLEVERQRKQEEEERRRREETIQRERRAQEAAEDRRRQEAERAKAEEAARRAAKEKAEAEAAERDRLEAKRKQEEEQARQKQEAEQRAAEAAAAEEKAKAEKEKAETAAPVAPETLPGPKNDNEAEHKRYLDIHQDLKKFRASMKEEAKQNPDLKTRMNNLRRQLRKCVSQLTNVKGANKKPVSILFLHIIASDN
jgi:nucleoporin GLE1